MTFVTLEIVLFSLSDAPCLWYDKAAKDKVRRNEGKEKKDGRDYFKNKGSDEEISQ